MKSKRGLPFRILFSIIFLMISIRASGSDLNQNTTETSARRYLEQARHAALSGDHESAVVLYKKILNLENEQGLQEDRSVFLNARKELSDLIINAHIREPYAEEALDTTKK
jgi:hypothetical protein